MSPSVRKLLERLNSLEETVRQTKADVAAAEERAARAEARAARLEDATGNLAAAVVNPKSISRRNLLMKAAGVGAAGVAGSLLLNRPKDAYAIFTWQGGAANAADFPTTVTATSGFPTPYVLQLDANQGSNGSTNIDGLRVIGTNQYSGIAAYGGNKGGTALFGIGGAATGTGGSGQGMRVWSGTSAATQFSNRSIEAFQQNQQPSVYTWNVIAGAAGASNHSSTSNGIWSWGADHGWGLWGDGGAGNGATPPVQGGVGVYGNSGPGGVGVVGYGDSYHYNDLLAAHGTAGFGNALGVGGWFTGGRAPLTLGSSGAAGPPTTVQHFVGDVWMDANRVLWICTVSGTPGTFTPLQPGGMNNALYTAVSTLQYTFVGSNGVTWADMDPTNLVLSITPNFNCQAVLTASADLWTAAAGYNQDIGIAVSGGAYPTVAGQPEGWKESGGFAGTYSPNAAHVDTIVPLAVGVAYMVKIVWKTNKPAAGKMIAAGAGPIGGKFSPTRLTAQLVATKAGGTTSLTPAKPYQMPDAVKPPAQQRPGKIPSPSR